MKYLISGEQVTAASTHEDQVKFLEAAKNWVEKGKVDGKVTGAYSFVDGGGMIIVDVRDHEELAQLLLTFPLGPFSNLDVRPVLDFSRNAELTIEAVKKIP